MKEKDVEDVVRKYIKKQYERKGWRIPKRHEHTKKPSEHGKDISLYKKGYGMLIIEVKRFSKSKQQNDNSFYLVFGQLLSRIHSPLTKDYSKKRKVIIAAPTDFITLMKKKIQEVKNDGKHGMIEGWSVFGKMTNLWVWSVDMKTENVKIFNWKDLKEKDFSPK